MELYPRLSSNPLITSWVAHCWDFFGFEYEYRIFYDLTHFFCIHRDPNKCNFKHFKQLASNYFIYQNENVHLNIFDARWEKFLYMVPRIIKRMECDNILFSSITWWEKGIYSYNYKNHLITCDVIFLNIDVQLAHSSYHL